MEDLILPLEYNIITEDIRLKAEQELNETAKTREKCLTEIKQMIQNEKHLVSSMSDNFLLQFLRVKRFKTEEAFSLLKRYYGHRRLYKSMYKKYSPQQHIEVMKSNIMNFLPWRSPDKCAMWVSRCGLWDSDVLDFEEILRFGLICHDKVLENPVTQICGLISIVDLKKFSWSHLFHISTESIKCFISATQNCFPIRHKAIHIINNPSLFSVLFTVIKPLLNKTIRNRIHFHGDNLSSLHKYLSPNLLPEEFGGSRGKFENMEFYSLLLDSEEDFLKNNEFGFQGN